jgi:hypothetical protein
MKFKFTQRHHPVDAAIDAVKDVIERRAEELRHLEGQELVRALTSAKLEERDLEGVDPTARSILAKHVGRRLFMIPAGVLHAYRAGSASKDMFIGAAVKSAFADWEALLLGEYADETRRAQFGGASTRSSSLPQKLQRICSTHMLKTVSRARRGGLRR